MKTSKIALIVYFVSLILSVFANIVKSDSLMLLVKPILIPALFFYYYFETKKVSFWIFIFLFLCFIGDSIGVLNFEDELYYILYPFFISNIIAIFIGLKDAPKYKSAIFNNISILVVALFLGYLWFSVVDLFSYFENNVKLKIGIFGVSLFLLGLIASYNITWKMSQQNIYFLVFASCVLISDVFYITYNFQNQLLILSNIHLATQLLSYYLIVKSQLSKESIVITQ